MCRPTYIYIAAFLAVAAHAAQVPPAYLIGSTSASVSTRDGVLGSLGKTPITTEGLTVSAVPKLTFVQQLFPSGEVALTGFAQSSVLTWLTPSPAIWADNRVESTTTGPALLTASGFSSNVLSYGMQILGPDADVPIRIDGLGITGVMGSSTGYALAQFELTDGRDVSLVRESHVNMGNPSLNTPDVIGNLGGFTIYDVLTLRTNTLYTLNLSVVSGVALSGNGNAVAYAHIDPTFQFVTSSHGSLYSFEFSTGIGNTPIASTPDSGGTVILLAFGLMCVFTLHWRKILSPV